MATIVLNKKMANELAALLTKIPEYQFSDGHSKILEGVHSFLVVHGDKNVCLVSGDSFDDLITARDELNALESWGVDNWSGYSDAMRELYPSEE